MATITIHDGIESYITAECGLEVKDLKTMTDAEIDGYFSKENFEHMFPGEGEPDYSYEDLQAAAKDLRDRANVANA